MMRESRGKKLMLRCSFVKESAQRELLRQRAGPARCRAARPATLRAVLASQRSAAPVRLAVRSAREHGHGCCAASTDQLVAGEQLRRQDCLRKRADVCPPSTDKEIFLSRGKQARRAMPKMQKRASKAGSSTCPAAPTPPTHQSCAGRTHPRQCSSERPPCTDETQRQAPGG